MPNQTDRAISPLRLFGALSAAVLAGLFAAYYNPAPRVVAHVNHDLHVAVYLADKLDDHL